MLRANLPIFLVSLSGTFPLILNALPFWNILFVNNFHPRICHAHFVMLLNVKKIISNSLDFSFCSPGLFIQSLTNDHFGACCISLLGAGLHWRALSRKPGCSTCRVHILQPLIPCTSPLCRRLVPCTSPASVANWVSLPGTHPWRASCAWSVISETQPPIDNFPPINCALFLSFNLRHAINCDLLHLGTCLCLSWRKHSRSCGEKLDSQNGMVPGSRTIRNARS